MAENEEKEIEEVDEDDDVIILQDENGNEIKRKIAFTVRDDMLHVLFVYVFEDDEETVDVCMLKSMRMVILLVMSFRKSTMIPNIWILQANI